MEEKISVDELNDKGVSIMKRKVTTIEGREYFIGDPFRRAYENSEAGRARIAKELPEPYLSAVMSVWGSAPTVFPKYTR